jgi:regulator of ribonuclease activity A
MNQKTTDLCDEQPDAVTLPAQLRDFGGTVRFSGRALTVKCYEDNSRIKELSMTPGDGRVLVVDGGASLRCALLGDVIAADLVKNGWRGAIIYGCIRDAAALQAMALGVKALATHPRKSQKHGAGVVGQPLDIGGSRVCVDDEIVADEDGVVVVRPAGSRPVS